MPQPQDKATLLAAAQTAFEELQNLMNQTDLAVLEADFLPSTTKAKCATFEQGDNLRDVLMHIFEWQRLQADFVNNIRQGTPKDFIPEPYRKNYKELDELNRQNDKRFSIQEAIGMLTESHGEMLRLIETFSDEELFGKKVFKVTYTTTMGAYFICVTTSPYGQALKRLKSHIRSTKSAERKK